MRFVKFTLKSERDNILTDFNGEVGPGLYQYFGRSDFLLALAGRKAFKGKLKLDRLRNFRSYRVGIERNELAVFFLPSIEEQSENRSPIEVLNSYLSLVMRPPESAQEEFYQLKDYFSLPTVGSFKSLSRGQQELYQFIIALCLQPKVLLGINSFEGLSLENFEKVKNLIGQKKGLTMIFSAGYDHTQATGITKLELSNGFLVGGNKDLLEIDINRKYRHIRSFKLKNNRMGDYILSTVLHALVATLLIFVSGSLYSSSGYEMTRLEKQLATGSFQHPIYRNVTDREDYYEAQIMFFSLGDYEVELRHDRIIDKGKIVDLELTSNQSVVTSALVALIGSKDKTESWLENFGLCLHRVVPLAAPALLLSDSAFNSFALEHLDSAKNIYLQADETYIYKNESGKTIIHDENAYYVPLDRPIDTSIIDAHGIPFGGYYIPQHSFDPILIGQKVDKDFCLEKNAPYHYRYLTTDPLQIPPEAQKGVTIDNYLNTVMLSDIAISLYVSGVFLTFLIFAGTTFKRSQKSLLKLLKEYRLTKLSFRNSYLNIEVNYFMANLFLALTIAVASVLFFKLSIVFLVIWLFLPAIIIKWVLARIIYKNYYRKY